MAGLQAQANALQAGKSVLHDVQNGPEIKCLMCIFIQPELTSIKTCRTKMSIEASQIALKLSNPTSSVEFCYFLIMISEIKKASPKSQKCVGLVLGEISSICFYNTCKTKTIFKRCLSSK